MDGGRSRSTASHLTLVVFLAFWTFCFAMSLRSQLTDERHAPFFATAGEGADALPVYTGRRTWLPDEGVVLRRGDRLVRFGAFGLAGASALDVQRAFTGAMDGEGRVEVTYERGGRRAETWVRGASYRTFWALVATAPFFVLVATIVWLRTPRGHPTRWLALALFCAGLHHVAFFGGSASLKLFAALVHIAAFTLFFPLALRALLALLLPSGPRGWLRLAPWALVPYGAVVGPSAGYGFPLSPQLGIAGMTGGVALVVGLFAALLPSLYGRLAAPRRRQLKWILWGAYCAAVPLLFSAVLATWDVRYVQIYMASVVFGIFVPLSVLFSVARTDLLDVDRLISATASYNVLLVAAAALLLVIVPRLAAAGFAAFGLDPDAGQIALSVLLVAAIVPLHRRLRPALERRFFKERYALEAGAEDLLRRIGAAGDLGQRLAVAGERLDTLVRPESLVVHVREPDRFAPALALGRIVPAALAAASPVVATLAERQRPLAASSPGLDAFERAALDKLRAAIVAPVRDTAANLVALVSLGAKRSGDVYTPADLALLGTLADRIGGARVPDG